MLVILVAVFLAYNANNGLPFVSTYDLKVRVPNAQALVKGNEVRIGGARVGTVRKVVPVQLENGDVAAELDATLGAAPFAACVLAPAFPFQGRITRGGRQHVRGADGAWTPLAVGLAAELAALGQALLGDGGDDKTPTDAVLDGEIVALDPQGRANFSRLQQRINLTGDAEIASARGAPIRSLSREDSRLPTG